MHRIMKHLRGSVCDESVDNGFMFALWKSEKLSVNTIGTGHTTKYRLVKDHMKWDGEYSFLFCLDEL